MKNYYISLDNTVCKTNNNDYFNSVPIIEIIEYINNLKKDGNKIIIWNNRNLNSDIDYRELTINQLNTWNIFYDELLMETPKYDINISDNLNNLDFLLPLPSEKNYKSKKIISEEVQKGWGKEIIFVNNEEYCGKLLCFDKGKKFSMHYHLKKKETWYVSKGKFILLWIDITNGIIHTEYLNVGDVITNERGEPHQLIALEDAEVFEVSTKHYDDDSFRIWKGN